MIRADKSASARGRGHWQQGLALARQAEWAQAAQAFGRAAHDVPGDIVYWLNLAHAEHKAGALPQAETAARRALALQPTHPLALRLLADCCLQMHRYAEAAGFFSQLDGQAEGGTETLMQHATALQLLGRHVEASAVLLKALARQPDLARAHGLLGDSCHARGLNREAIECFKTVIALQPDNLEAWVRLSFQKRHVMDWSDFDQDNARIAELAAAAPADAARMTAALALLSLPLPPQAHRRAAEMESRALAQTMPDYLKLPNEDFDAEAAWLMTAYLAPFVRPESAALVSKFASASMDVSDGLVTDAGKLAEASGVALKIEINAVPFAIPAERWAFTGGDVRKLITGGDDYVVLFTAPSELRGAVEAAEGSQALRLARIGVVEAGQGVTVVDAKGQAIAVPDAGYSHKLGH